MAETKDQPKASIDPTTIPIESWGWTRRQRIGLGILLALLLIVLGLYYWRRPATIGDTRITESGATPQRIDPNTASIEELSRLPQLGEALARRIVDYREARKGTTADGIVFRQPSDLDSVPGIGPKLVERFEPFMKFPEK